MSSLLKHEVILNSSQILKSIVHDRGPWDRYCSLRLIAVMETHKDNNIVGTLSRVHALVSEIIIMVRALREEISDQMTEVRV